MDIKRESIRGYGKSTGIVDINWFRPHTPYINDKKAKYIDSVEFSIDHHGIEKLEQNVEETSEFIECFVHFNAGTETLDGIYFTVLDAIGTSDNPILVDLNENEKKVIVEYAIGELRKERSC